MEKLKSWFNKRNKGFNPETDSWNERAVGYNQAIKDVLKFIKEQNKQPKKVTHKTLLIRYNKFLNKQFFGFRLTETEVLNFIKQINKS